MALRFVKTSILSSSDGIDFADETAVESEEVVKARVAAEAARNKPLYQQLAEGKEKKLEEYNENTKKIFAPTKALDEEDAQFLNDLEDAKARVERSNKQQDIEAIEAFRDARKIDSLNAKGASAPTLHLANLKKSQSIPQPCVKFNVKRKIRDLASHQTSDDTDSKAIRSSQEGEMHNADAPVARPSVDLLCAYGSDSD